MLRFVNGSRLLDFVPNSVLHEKLEIENFRQRLFILAKKQVNVIQAGNLHHVETLQNFVAPQVHGTSLWNDISN